MRSTTSLGSLSLVALSAVACGATEPIGPDVNHSEGAPASSGGVATSGGAMSSGASLNAGRSNSVSRGGVASATAGGAPETSGGTAPTAGNGIGGSMAGSSPASGGDTSMGGGAGTPASGGAIAMGGAGAGGAGGRTDPYAPRTGSFKMLTYSIAKGYRHSSIEEGQKMLQDIGKTQGFEVTIAQDNSEITEAGLAQYEIVFFMNPSGDVFKPDEEKAFEAWMTKSGAFAGCHAATDTEGGWAFYGELTGQYNDSHEYCCAEADIQWEPGVEEFAMVKGLPSPWTRAEEWVGLQSYQTWSAKAGFTILSMVTTGNSGTRPVSYLREWGTFRSFYTSLGHESSTFRDEDVKKHIAAGIMWAVRREALIK